MSAVIVLTGGGIKGAVTAAHYARAHELILVHIDHGQVSARNEARAVGDLAPFWPQTRLLSPVLPGLDQLPQAVRTSVGTVTSRTATASPANDPAMLLSLRGLLPEMLAVGARAALRFGASSVAVGVSAFSSGEHIGLPGPEAGPDARREVLHAFNITLDALLRPRSRVRVEAPLMDLNDAEIVKLGRRLSVPLERTWTCTSAYSDPCGRCPPCRARGYAFVQAGLVDPASKAYTAQFATAPSGAAVSANP